jgi:hypothetical protein
MTVHHNLGANELRRLSEVNLVGTKPRNSGGPMVFDGGAAKQAPAISYG